MGFLGYLEAGMYVYNAYNEGKFDNMINKFANNYPTMYGRVNNFIHAPASHNTYGYTPARHGHR